MFSFFSPFAMFKFLKEDLRKKKGNNTRKDASVRSYWIKREYVCIVHFIGEACWREIRERREAETCAVLEKAAEKGRQQAQAPH